MSKKFDMNLEDAKKLLKGAGIAAAGGVASYGLEVLPYINFPDEWQVLAAGVCSVVCNAILKWCTNNS